MSSFSMTQSVGIGFYKAAMAATLAIILFCCVIVAMESAGTAYAIAYAASDSVFRAAWIAFLAIILEIAKPLLPMAYLNQKHHQPLMAAAILALFSALLLVSMCLTFLQSLFLPDVGTDRVQAIMLLFVQVFATGGPLVWYNNTKWSTETTSDGLAPVRPAQPDPSAAPRQETTPAQQPMSPPAMTLGAAFAAWVGEKIEFTKADEGHLPIMLAYQSYNTWAAAHSYPTANTDNFNRLIKGLANQNGLAFADGIVHGVNLTQDMDQSFGAT